MIFYQPGSGVNLVSTKQNIKTKLMATQFIFGRPLRNPRSDAKDKRAEWKNPDPVISPGRVDTMRNMVKNLVLTVGSASPDSAGTIA